MVLVLAGYQLKAQQQATKLYEPGIILNQSIRSLQVNSKPTNVFKKMQINPPTTDLLVQLQQQNLSKNVISLHGQITTDPMPVAKLYSNDRMPVVKPYINDRMPGARKPDDLKQQLLMIPGSPLDHTTGAGK